MHSNAKMEFLRKCVRQQWFPYSGMFPPDIMYNGSMGNPLIPKSVFVALLLAEFKNKYVNANTDLL